jgi:hypothetical protein
MTSAPVRDPVADHLLTPQNAALPGQEHYPRQERTVGGAPGCRISGLGQAGGAKNSSAIPSGSRKETPEP